MVGRSGIRFLVKNQECWAETDLFEVVCIKSPFLVSCMLSNIGYQVLVMVAPLLNTFFVSHLVK